MNDAAPTLPEELLLLALDPVRGKPYCRGRFLEYGIAGAALAELELQGRIAEERGRVVVVNPLDPPDPLLAVFLHSLPPPGKGGFLSGASARRWVRQAGRRAEGLYLDALVERGVLRRETRRFLGLLPYHRHPAGSASTAEQVRQRFEESRAAGHPDRRGRLLAALAAAVELPAVVRGGDRRTRAATRALVRQEWPAQAVHRNVRQDKASHTGGGDGGGSGGGD
ncbi:GPP34 family phosphoprotein [Streptomyces sp. JH34]|uniref:GOLPH3/VPS74 family protein n=1 Tax=Streptomyces sp. JH34 TaxID=2793633 RepID=UPI0023F7F0F1|nr:GPP34 family phosphoprotein [Streptomyces sp. JH34]MDF6019470.1 GPP34 family phosphoprotein [Streptomyces sp. JH34]